MVASCSTDDEETKTTTNPPEPTFNNLAEFIAIHSPRDSAGLIACAASDAMDSSLVSIFFLPPDSMREPRYFENDNLPSDQNDFSQYTERDNPIEPVFQGFLRKAIRQNSDEGWSIVTALSPKTFHRCNPIRLKNNGKATEYSDQMTIDFMDSGRPRFDWQDGRIKENVIYFQAITDDMGRMVSATYTTDKFFKYNDFSNVVLDVNRMPPPPVLKKDEDYKITLMAVSLDNWVNLVIEKEFTMP
jgi:hypothetical protein